MKCFTISLHRTGTRSTAAYLRALGLSTRHWPIEHDGVNLEKQIVGQETNLQRVTDVLTPVLDHYQAVADVPIPVLYRELFTRYPDAKFLLVLRHPFDWLASVRWKLRKRELTPYERTVYWTYLDWRPQRVEDMTDAQLLWLYSRHVADAIEFFQKTAPERLGIFDLYACDTGDRIAAFLGVPPANAPFPHVMPRSRGAQEVPKPVRRP